MPKKRFLCETSHFIEIHQDSSKFIGKPSHFSFVVMISQQKFDVRRTSKSDESSIVYRINASAYRNHPSLLGGTGSIPVARLAIHVV